MFSLQLYKKHPWSSLNKGLELCVGGSLKFRKIFCSELILTLNGVNYFLLIFTGFVY